MNEPVVIEAVDRLVRHAEYLRQINSNLAFKYQRRSTVMNWITVGASSAVTFIAFTGIPGLRTQLLAAVSIDEGLATLVFNLVVLSLVILAIGSLILKYPERASVHMGAIRRLTEFIGPASDVARAARAGVKHLTWLDASELRLKYLIVVADLPPSTDQDFYRAKLEYAKKQEMSAEPPESTGTIEPVSERSVREILSSRVDVLAIIGTLAAVPVEHELWVTGGAVRNPVWDALTGRNLAGFPSDVDVIYFDPNDITRETEQSIQGALALARPDLTWDVRNQARSRHDEGAPPISLADAIARFPDTPSTWAVRLHGNELMFLAPNGLDDLVKMRVDATSESSRSRALQRADEKQWKMAWPNLDLSPLTKPSPEW